MPPARLLELAEQAGPFAVVLLLFIGAGMWFLWKREVQRLEDEATTERVRFSESRDNYRKRIKELEAKNERLQNDRLVEFKEQTATLTRIGESMLVQAQAMETRSETAQELTERVRELIVLVKLQLSGLGGKIVS